MVALCIASPSAATVNSVDDVCDPESIQKLIESIATDYVVASPSIKNRTLVIEVSRGGEDWRGVLTLNVADDTVYTSVGGSKLTPELRPKLQTLVEKAAATAALRQVLKRCAQTTVKEAEQASTNALQSQIDATKTEPPPPTREESAASFYITMVLPLLWALLIIASLAALWRRQSSSHGGSSGFPAWGAVGLCVRLLIPPCPETFQIPSLVCNLVREHLVNFGHYGRGIEGLLILVSPLLGSGEDTLAGINLLIAVLTIPLMYALVRRLGYNVNTSHLAALCLALAPLHIRFSPTYNRYIVFVFLMLLAWTMLLAFLAHRRPMDLVLSLSAMALGMQCRPEAAILPLAAGGRSCARHVCGEQKANHVAKVASHDRIGSASSNDMAPVSSVLSTAGDHERWVTEYIDKGRPLFDPNYNAFMSSWLNPFPWAFLALVGLLRPPENNRWVVAWTTLMALGFTGIVATRHLGTTHVIDARYHLSALPFYLILTASGTQGLIEWVQQRLPSKARLVAFCIGGLVAASSSMTMASASLRTTMNQEYEFVRDPSGDPERLCNRCL